MSDVGDVPDKTLKSGDVAAAVSRVLAASTVPPTLDELHLVYAQTVYDLEGGEHKRGAMARAARRLGVTQWRLARLLARREAA